ncbi:accessory Sec system translocase SecA2 [Lentibacillus cibarius]|uniref:Protein translocase subunit SecA n=1 Tax=Lentibacillus cibarius TaxID=2583219 RepID=A0A5S3QIM4_9BACI|nr:accessory Sec system translocase SecA2 [Lentibacillus cibarius]TMN21772.1 accessory Sec system translocase SecA2 [Lentibacillus cibarius]
MQLLKKNRNQSKNNRALKRYYKMLDKINRLEKDVEHLTDDALQEKTNEFRNRLQQKETIYDLAPEAFAVVRETSRRVLGLRHYDVQIIGGLVLLDNNISEMATGEGKTLVASLPTYLVALEGKGVHIITVNEYLARRDKELIGQIHEFLGLNVGLNVGGLSPAEKQAAYHCDITYGVGNEFGFDFLRDNTVQALSQKVQRPFHYAIIDEVDSVLIDEAKTPLIIAGKDKPSDRLYDVCARVIKGLKEDEDFTFDLELKTVNFTEKGMSRCEKVFGIDNLFDLEHSSLFHSLLQALRARMLFERDVDYIVEQGEVKLIDMNTGRVMEGRSLSDGLHQAIESKEGLVNTEENKTHASITVQNYYRMYPKLAGMTGTAKTEETELNKVYGMQVVSIPTNKPNQRVDMPDMVFMTKEQKYEQLVKEVRKRHDKGQPILIGTTSVRQSELVAEYLDKQHIQYELLNAKSVEQEAHLIAMAGQKGQITIATNMAGRGTDIMLGEGVAELGGLHVIGTERNESRRIDNQLKGRSARQGDPGSTQFIISLEDYLFIRFASDELERVKPKLKEGKNGLIKSDNVHKFVDTAQKISEGMGYQFREFNLNLEDVINDQRKVTYELRDHLLEADNPIAFITRQIADLPDQFVDSYCQSDVPNDWDLAGMEQALNAILLTEVTFGETEFETVDEIKAYIQPAVDGHKEQLQSLEENEQLQKASRAQGLFVIDTVWKKHLDRMNQLKEGIGMRQYQQENPLDLFKKEGYRLFEESYHEITYQFASRLKQLIEKVREQQKADTKARKED